MSLAPWAEAALAQALEAWRGGRLGHATLVCGPEQLGKRELTRALAARLLCQAPKQGAVCGVCRSSRQLSAGLHPDFKYVSFIPTEKGDKLRSELVVEQMRDLGSWFSLTPQLGGAQVAIIEPAEAMNNATANALLKTLEEPAPNRFLLLVSDRPGRLAATVRSRCQRLQLRLPDAAAAAQWLQQRGHSAQAAAQALQAARGHPGLADQWLREDTLKLRTQVAGDLAALAARKRSPVQVAQAWMADEHADLRLRHAGDLALDCVASGLAARPPMTSGLTPPPEFNKLPSWFEAIGRIRRLLGSPVRTDLALAGALLEWRELFAD